MNMTTNEVQMGRLQDFTIDQFAGAFALSLGAVGTLLLVIWQSRCLCKCRLGISDNCYLFDCERAPPPLEEDKKKKDDKKKPPVAKTKSDEESLIPEETQEKTPASTPASTPKQSIPPVKPNILQLEEVDLEEQKESIPSVKSENKPQE